MAEITISSFQIPGLQFVGVEAGELRLYASRTFPDSDGEIHLGGAEGDQQGFYQACPFTVTDGVITVASFVTVSTLDAQDNAPSTILITGALFSADGQFLQNLFSGWQIPSSTPTTFAALYNLNRSVYLPIAPVTLVTQQQMIDYVDTVLGEQAYASDVVAGITYLTDAPVSSTNPIAVGDNNSRLISSLTYAALALITAITGVIKFCSDRLKGLYYKTSAAIWCSLTGRANVLDHGCTGDGSTDCRSALNTLFNTTLATTGGIVYFPHYQNAANTDYLVGSNLTIPANVTLELAPGARLKVATGVTVTCLAYIPLTPFQMFSLQGTGTISFAGNTMRLFLAAWWGVKGDNSTTGGGTIINAIIAQLYSDALSGSTLQLPAGTILIDNALQDTSASNAQILLPKPSTSQFVLTIEGTGQPGLTLLYASTAGTILKSTLSSGNGFVIGTKIDATTRIWLDITFKNLVVQLPTDPTNSGIDLGYIVKPTLENVKVWDGQLFDAGSVPTTTTSDGIRWPFNNMAGQAIGRNVVVAHFRRAMEHTELVDLSGITLANNYIGLYGRDGYWPNHIRDINFEHNIRNVVLDGTGTSNYVAFEDCIFNIEDAPSGTWATTYDFDDTGNIGKGTITWNKIVSGSGAATTILQNGASNLALLRAVDAGTALTAYTPIVTSGTGTITTLGTVTGGVRKAGKRVTGRVGITITTNGTGATYIQVTLPFTNNVFSSFTGMETGAKTLLKAYSPDSGTAMIIQTYDGLYPGGDGKVLIIDFDYEAA